MTDEFNVENYWEKRLTENYDIQGVGFQSLSKGYNEWLYRIREKRFLQIAKKHSFSKRNVLDIGSGTGFYVNLWDKLQAKRIIGIDITETAVSNLSNQFQDHKFFKIDISKPIPATLKNKSPFDTISAMDVLFHLVSDKKYEKSLHNIYDLLKPGGYFVWSDNFLHSEEVRSDHIVHRKLNRTKTLLNNIGFSIIDRRPMFIMMNQPIDSNNRIYNQLWKIIKRFAAHNELTGFIFGGMLYPLELILTNLRSESPTTEIMVCQK